MAFLNNFPIVIAEIGNNHGGSLELAKRMVLAALEAGTPYVKFQTMIPELVLARDDPAFLEFSREALSFDAFRVLNRFCKENGAVFLSTPFDLSSADLLEELEVPAFKIASGDLTHVLLLRHISRKHRPILLSTGASTWLEIDRAVRIIREVSSAELVLLHCTAAYPVPDGEVNLRVITEMQRRYDLPVGFSDHSRGIDLALAAAAIGARVIEKHFTTDRSLHGGDNEISILPGELSQLVDGTRCLRLALGSPERDLTPSEKVLRPAMRRSVALQRDLEAGEVIAEGDLTGIRPEIGIPADELDGVTGRRARVSIKALTPLRWDDLMDEF